MTDIPLEIFKIIASAEPSPMEPGMHGEVSVKKPGKDLIEQVIQIKDICDSIIESYGCDECEDDKEQEGKEDRNEFREMRSKSEGQGKESNQEQEA